MRRQYCIWFSLLIALLSIAHGQEATTGSAPPASTTPWSGDPKLCPRPSATTVTPPRTPPTFAKRAEFAIEQIEYKEIGPSGVPGHKVLYEHVYDYDANSLIIVKNQDGFITATYFYYNKLKKSVYTAGQYCTVDDIDTDKDMDGTSAVQFADGTWHIRPLNEYLLFSAIDPARPRRDPIFIEDTIVHGIPVEVWSSCYVIPEQFRTVRRVWSLAKRGTQMPWGVVGNEAVPIQAIISASISFPNGTEIAEVDEIYNVFNYRPGIQESASDVSPPKSVFCAGGDDKDLATLDELGIAWPDHFSVRVEASTTRLAKWERFHLRYNLGRQSGTRRLRYDFLPPGADDFKSVIHDYTDQLTYTIDRRLGSCDITRGVEYPDVSPLRDPIEFFIKHEMHTIFNPPAKRWQFNGYRACRGSTIKCAIATTSIDNFPTIVDPDTGNPTGETWLATNVEYGWSARSPTTSGQRFDYPVTLFMKMYRFRDPLSPNVARIESQNVEYEFYEMSEDRSPYDFDISTCYRSNAYEYLHVFFSLKSLTDNVVDSDRINYARLEYEIIQTIMDKSQVRKFSRVADVEIEHEKSGDTLNVFFTLLGQTRVPETSSFNTSEPTADAAYKDLKAVIDGEQFKFTITLNDGTTADFQAEKGSLRAASEYMSTHGRGKTIVSEEYSSGAQAVAIIVGLLIGIIVGVVVIVIVRVARKEPVPGVSGPLRNPIPSVNFNAKRNVPSNVTDA